MIAPAVMSFFSIVLRRRAVSTWELAIFEFQKISLSNEAKCETFVVKMSFICIIIKNHFHINGFALSLALKVRFFGTRKWPIVFRAVTPETYHSKTLNQSDWSSQSCTGYVIVSRKKAKVFPE